MRCSLCCSFSIFSVFEKLLSIKKEKSLEGISCFGLRLRQSTQDVLFLTPHPLCDRCEGGVSGAKGCRVFKETSSLLQRCSDREWPAGGSTVTACAHYLSSPLQKGSSESHTKRPHMHIELSDLLRRPGQWCFKSSTTLSALLSHNCSDRIGSEMCVGLKIGLLLWHELNNLGLYEETFILWMCESAKIAGAWKPLF